MEHQQKVDKKPIGRLLSEGKAKSSYLDKRVRISEDFKFYGVTKTQAGDAEISLALKILKEDGEQLVIQYHEFISPMRFDGATEIRLSTLYLSIKITGKNLGILLDYLAEHRLVWVKEPDSDFIEVAEGEVEISEIEVKDKA